MDQPLSLPLSLKIIISLFPLCVRERIHWATRAPSLTFPPTLLPSHRDTLTRKHTWQHWIDNAELVISMRPPHPLAKVSL